MAKQGRYTPGHPFRYHRGIALNIHLRVQGTESISPRLIIAYRHRVKLPSFSLRIITGRDSGGSETSIRIAGRKTPCRSQSNMLGEKEDRLAGAAGSSTSSIESLQAQTIPLVKVSKGIMSAYAIPAGISRPATTRMILPNFICPTPRANLFKNSQNTAVLASIRCNS
jgi:hypothetical protein